MKTRFARKVGVIVGLLVLVAGIVAVGKKVNLGSAPTVPSYRLKGSSKASVVIVEYSDFQCPACRPAAKPLKNLLLRYPEEIQLRFKHFPLEKPHRWARLAAKSAECAGRQEKFWAYHDLLFENQRRWSKSENPLPTFKTYADEVGLNSSRFTACLDDPTIEAAIDKDKSDGAAQSVGSTPTFFINGERYVGARQLQREGFGQIRLIIKPWKKK